MEALFFQEGNVTGQGGGVAGDVDQAAGGHAADGFDGVGVQALAGRVHGDDVRADALLFQLQGGLACVAAEEFRVFDAVASGVVPGILHGLGNHLHPNDLAGGGGHGQGDGAHTAVEVQHQILFGDARQVDGSLVEALGLVVVHLVEGAGGQAELEAAEGILDEARAIERDEFIPQHGVALFGVDAEHQGGEAGDFFQTVNQLLCVGQLLPVCHQADENLAGHRAPADIDVAQQTPVGNFVVGGDMELIYIIHYRILHHVRFLGENQAAAVFHHLVGARPEKSGVGSSLFAGHGVLGFVPIAKAGGGGEDGHFLQLLPGQSVQAGFHPLRFQPGLLLIVHVPEVAAAAELGHGAFPVHPVGGFFQNFGDFPRCPGFAQSLNAHLHPLPGDGIGDEHCDAIDVGNALTLGGVVGDDRFINSILFQHIFSL